MTPPGTSSRAADNDNSAHAQIRISIDPSDARTVHGTLRLTANVDDFHKKVRGVFVDNAAVRLIESGNGALRLASRSWSAVGSIVAQVKVQSDGSELVVTMDAKPAVRFVFGPSGDRVRSLVKDLLEQVMRAF